MRTIRSTVLTFVASAWVIVLVSPRRRSALARRLADARRAVSHRIVDEDARASARAASARAVDAWEDEGGAMQGASAAPDDARTRTVGESRPK